MEEIIRICDTCRFFYANYDVNPAYCDASCEKEDELLKLEEDGIIDTGTVGYDENCPIWEESIEQ